MTTSCLLTGGAGFIGSHVARAILQRPKLVDRCVILDDLSGGSRENLPPDTRAIFVNGSITDHALVDRVFQRYEPRYIYHLAAYAAEGLSHFIRRFNYTNNIIGSVNLLNAAIRHESECFVFTSSIAVYGSTQVPMVETTMPLPEDPYGIAKLAVEQDLSAAQRIFGQKYISFRLHNVFGERQNIADRYRNVVGIFMNHILQGRPMPIFGDGNQVRAFTYVGDIADVIARAPLVPQASNRVMNLGTDHAITVNELAVHVAVAMEKPGHPVHHLPPRSEVPAAYANHDLSRECLGPIEETSLADALGRMAKWVRHTGARQPETRHEIEIRKGLPQSWQTDSDSGSP